jgi:uncharacterized protein (TIGR02246 family)
MRKVFMTAIVVVVAATWFGVGAEQGKGGDQGKQPNVRADIEAVNKQLTGAFAKKDAAAAAALYTTDAVAYPPNGPAVSGRAAIQKMWAGVIASGVTDATLTTAEVDAQGNIAWETGTYVMRVAGKPVDNGKYIVIWKREQGQWRLHRDIWNTNMPAPAPK